jgi:hypothetical protein
VPVGFAVDLDAVLPQLQIWPSLDGPHFGHKRASRRLSLIVAFRLLAAPEFPTRLNSGSSFVAQNLYRGVELSGGFRGIFRVLGEMSDHERGLNNSLTIEIDDMQKYTARTRSDTHATQDISSGCAPAHRSFSSLAFFR